MVLLKLPSIPIRTILALVSCLISRFYQARACLLRALTYLLAESLSQPRIPGSAARRAHQYGIRSFASLVLSAKSGGCLGKEKLEKESSSGRVAVAEPHSYLVATHSR
jgi:hypothetical protein